MSTPENESNVPFFIGFALGFVAIVALGYFIVWMIIDSENYYDEQQKKQDACLKSGGMWIDNRHTDSYCFRSK